MNNWVRTMIVDSVAPSPKSSQHVYSAAMACLPNLALRRTDACGIAVCYRGYQQSTPWSARSPSRS